MLHPNIGNDSLMIMKAFVRKDPASLRDALDEATAQDARQDAHQLGESSCHWVARTLRISRRRHVQLPNLGIQPNNRRVNSKYSETTNIKFGPFPCHKTRFFFQRHLGFHWFHFYGRPLGPRNSPQRLSETVQWTKQKEGQWMINYSWWFILLSKYNML